ncbi:MAG: GNAT family N-acetyltransferase [Clostridia bacterium]|nr:GNAT family N-acetyltransferase [Clostridia bacterium]
MLTLYEPKYEDLWFRQAMLADQETMSYNHAWGGTIPWPETEWRGWYDHWLVHHEGKRYYRYLKDPEGRFVGEIAYHYDAGIRHETADVIIYAPYRRKGYGAEGLALLCSEAKRNGVSVLYDDMAADNPAVRLFLKHGFTEEYRTEEKIYLRKALSLNYRFIDRAEEMNAAEVAALLKTTYWADKRSMETIEKSMRCSSCYGVRLDEEKKLAGFARVISDYATTYYLCDVVIDPAYRGRGLGKALVSYIVSLPEYATLRGLLLTKDAHGLYEQFGFETVSGRAMFKSPKS